MNIVVYKCFVLKINDTNLKLYDNVKSIKNFKKNKRKMKKLKIKNRKN